MAIGTGIGAFAFAVRAVTTKDSERTWGQTLVHALYGVLTASLTSLLVFLAVFGYVQSRDVAVAAAGAAGWASPELIRAALRKIKKS